MFRPDQQSVYSCYHIRDRRGYPRYTVQVPIELEVEGCETILSAETTDLSRNGCYVRFRSPFPVSLRVHAILWLGTVPIQIEGRIVTRHPEFGNGIMFLKIQDRDAKALATYLEAVTAESVV
jgi:hypothetical protein